MTDRELHAQFTAAALSGLLARCTNVAYFSYKEAIETAAYTADTMLETYHQHWQKKLDKI